MNPRQRQLPARENLIRIQKSLETDENKLAFDVVGIEVMLHLLRVADIIRYEVYKNLTKEESLSEGKFSLLMVLRDVERPCTTGELARQLGVSDPTVSIMVKRMLKDSSPWISREVSRNDARVSLISLSKIGRERIDKLLPAHFDRVAKFAAPLTTQDRETLVALLEKLVGANISFPSNTQPQVPKPA